MKMLDVFGLKPDDDEHTNIHNRQSPSRSFGRKATRPLMLFASVISLTGVVGYRFYNQPKLDVDTIANVTIVAPKDGKFEDKLTTQQEQEDAQKAVVPVLKQDLEINAKLKGNLQEFLYRLEEIRSLTATTLIEPQIIDTQTQRFLLLASPDEWQYIEENLTKEDVLFSDNKQLDKALEVLKKYSKKVNELEFNVLLSKIQEVKLKSKQKSQKILTEENPLLTSEEKINKLIKLNTASWEKTKTSILIASEMILSQGIPQGLPDSILEKTVTKQLAVRVPKETEKIATEILKNLLAPNLIVDTEETQNRAKQAASKVNPVFVEIKSGEVIVESGEKITRRQFVLLDNFGLSRRSVNLRGLGLSATIVTGTVIIFCLVAERLKLKLRRRDYILLCFFSFSAPMFTVIGISHGNLPAIAILVGSFYNPSLAIIHVTFTGGLVLFASDANQWEYLLASWLASVFAASKAGHMRSREELACLGLRIGLIQGAGYLILSLFSSSAAGIIWYVLLPAAALKGLEGIAWSVVALGISPLLERFFDIITPTRLAELSNPNCPLLQRLATQAPGTFQHTLFVACLAEAAARELNCNVELIRAGTLYHDIGKLHDPQCFIENQMGAPNKHDEINDPWKSAAIIKKHVTEGLVMARQYGLPKVIRDFIPQHQGTLVIAYFYYQAKQTDNPVDESDFRYDGPIPQSREAGIVMLADGCEAALRSLKEATPDVALSVVSKIIKGRWQEGELVDCGLEYYELNQIAKIFVRVWQQYNHKRITYPKGALEPRCIHPKCDPTSHSKESA